MWNSRSANLPQGGTGRERAWCAAPINFVLTTEQDLLEWSLSWSCPKDTEHVVSKPELSTEDQIIMCSPAELTTLQ